MQAPRNDRAPYPRIPPWAKTGSHPASTSVAIRTVPVSSRLFENRSRHSARQQKGIHVPWSRARALTARRNRTGRGVPMRKIRLLSENWRRACRQMAREASVTGVEDEQEPGPLTDGWSAASFALAFVALRPGDRRCAWQDRSGGIFPIQYRRGKEKKVVLPNRPRIKFTTFHPPPTARPWSLRPRIVNVLNADPADATPTHRCEHAGFGTDPAPPGRPEAAVHRAPPTLEGRRNAHGSASPVPGHDDAAQACMPVRSSEDSDGVRWWGRRSRPVPPGCVRRGRPPGRCAGSGTGAARRAGRRACRGRWGCRARRVGRRGRPQPSERAGPPPGGRPAGCRRPTGPGYGGCAGCPLRPSSGRAARRLIGATPGRARLLVTPQPWAPLRAGREGLSRPSGCRPGPVGDPRRAERACTGPGDPRLAGPPLRPAWVRRAGSGDGRWERGAREGAADHRSSQGRGRTALRRWCGDGPRNG